MGLAAIEAVLLSAEHQQEAVGDDEKCLRHHERLQRASARRLRS